MNENQNSANRSGASYEDLPDILYIASPTVLLNLTGMIFLTPHIGIASLFLNGKHELTSIRGCGCCIGYREWTWPDEDLQKPLEYVHVTHNVAEVANIEHGASSGYIFHCPAFQLKISLM